MLKALNLCGVKPISWQHYLLSFNLNYCRGLRREPLIRQGCKMSQCQPFVLQSDYSKKSFLSLIRVWKLQFSVSSTTMRMTSNDIIQMGTKQEIHTFWYDKNPCFSHLCALWKMNNVLKISFECIKCMPWSRKKNVYLKLDKKQLWN